MQRNFPQYLTGNNQRYKLLSINTNVIKVNPNIKYYIFCILELDFIYKLYIKPGYEIVNPILRREC